MRAKIFSFKFCREFAFCGENMHGHPLPKGKWTDIYMFAEFGYKIQNYILF